MEKKGSDGFIGRKSSSCYGTITNSWLPNWGRYPAYCERGRSFSDSKRAKTQASLGGYDIYMLDTAGRLHIDQELIAQAAAVRDVANPRETLLVVDGLTGQDAVNVATEFDDKIGVGGVVLANGR